MNTSQLAATSFIEQTPVAVCSDIVISDPDGDANWNRGRLSVQISGNAEAADSLGLATSYPDNGGIWLDSANGNALRAGNLQIGTADAASACDGTAWTFTFNDSATNDIVQATARSIIFNNSSDTPSELERTVMFTVTDNLGAYNSIEQTVTVTSVSSNGQPMYNFNGHSYQLTTGAMTWEEAEAEAVAHGGHLASVNSSAENQWLFDNFANSEIWIGFNDRQQEGLWVWTDSSPITYTNWADGEPSNDGTEGEDVAHIFGVDNSSFIAGTWNDWQGSNHQLYGIIEYPSLFAPVIITNGGNSTAFVSVAENDRYVTTVRAMDADADNVTYAITGGADQDIFTINIKTGELQFVSAPNYEIPVDANVDNIYVLEATASDGKGGVDTQTIAVTITDVNEEASYWINRTPIYYTYQGKTSGERWNLYAFAALKSDGTVVTWGHPDYGGDSSGVASELTGVQQVYSNYGALAALKRDGSVVTWGNPGWGGDSSGVASELTGVQQIYSNDYAFAALKSDGTVVTWGYSGWGGDSSGVASELTSVQQVYSNEIAFAALKSDGTVVTWGSSWYGGDSSGVAFELTGVQQVYSNGYAFAVLKSDGIVVTWGEPEGGGDSSGVASELTCVQQVYSTVEAFAALKSDGTVVTWGDSLNGGDSSGVASELTGVQQIYSNDSAFAALKSDGTVVTWGDSNLGGDSSWVASELTGVQQIYSTRYAFAALKSDGSVVTWGDSWSGGDSSWVASALIGVQQVYSNEVAFAALKSDGTVITWGEASAGGDSSLVTAQLTGVQQIYSTSPAFAALKSDGTVVTWGGEWFGGDSSGVADQLTNVVGLADISTDDNFHAVINNDTTAPTLTSSAPSDNATGVVVGSNIVLTFSETIQHGSGTIAIHAGSPNGTVVESYDAATSANLTIAGNTLTINPAADLAKGTHYFVTFENGNVTDLAGNPYVGTNTYDFTTEALPPVRHDISGSITFWKTGAPITGVTSTLTTVPAVTSTQPIELRNIHLAADGSRTIEIWETSSKSDIGNVYLDFILPTGSAASWQDATGLPSGWSSVTNAENPGTFILGSMGVTALSSGSVQLGTLTLTVPTNLQHFELLLRSGQLGNDAVPAFGIVSDTMTTGTDGLYQHLDMFDGSYAMSSAKISGIAESNAIKSNDALAALKIAVGMNPNADGRALSPYQYLAADVNHDGVVKAVDARNIMRMAVKLSTAPEKEWLFVPESVGSETMSRMNVLWPDNPTPVTLDADQDLHLIGIVQGDVNGSWVA